MDVKALECRDFSSPFSLTKHNQSLTALVGKDLYYNLVLKIQFHIIAFRTSRSSSSTCLEDDGLSAIQQISYHTVESA